MKKALLTGLAALPLLLSAQTIYFEDDFESYTAQDYLCTQSSTWTTWDNAPGTPTDAFITDANSAMGDQSLLLESISGAGPTDLVLPLGDQTSGQWTVAFYIFVVNNNGGYFNLQKTAAPGTEWAIEVYFNSDSSGVWTADDNDFAFSYSNEGWVHVEVMIDLDADYARGFVEGVEVGAWQWSQQTDGDPGMNQLGGMNIYAAALSGPALYFIDEVVITGPDAFVTSIEENEAISFDMYPSPVNDILNISVEDPQNMYINIYDVTGKVVMENISMSIGMNTSTVDVSDLEVGVYLLEMNNGEQRFAKRFVKE